MKVFLCWSGDMSHKVAGALRDWLPFVIQSVKPFISSEDIDKGERWSDALAQELEDTSFGIICLTPYNINAPWINFEAGAISKAIDRTYVSPFLFRVDPTVIHGPLSQFQFTKYEKEDIFNLLSSINNRLATQDTLTHELLRSEFEVWWPKLQKTLDAVTDVPEVETETGFPWLYSEDDLERIETSVDCKAIWAVTPQPSRYLRLPKSIDIIQKNLARGVLYIFVIPSSAKADTVDDLQNLTDLQPQRVLVKDVPDDQFRQLAVTEYVIINPDFDDKYALRVFLELPVTAGGYWIEVDLEAGTGFVSRFRKLADGDS
jgi:hypothetical protein